MRLTLPRILAALALALTLATPAHADDADYGVTIAGGGPVGLASAIEASRALEETGGENDRRVLVLEKRKPDRQRENVLNLTEATVHNLAHLGVELEGIVKPVHERYTTGQREKHVRVPTVDPDPGRATADERKIMSRGVVAQVHIHDLEKALYEAAGRRGNIDIKFEHEVSDVTRGQRSVEVTADARKGERRFSSDMLVVADGARSPTREMLGVAFEPVSDLRSRLVAGVFEQPRDGTLVRHEDRTAKGESQRVVGLKGAKHAGVLAEIPESLDLNDPAEREAWFRKRAEKVGVSGNIKTGPSEFETKLSRAETHVAGDNAVIVGDAAATTHVFSSVGFNVGLGHAIRFGRFLRERLEAKTRPERREAARRFDRHLERMTERMQRRGFRSFPLRQRSRNTGRHRTLRRQNSRERNLRRRRSGRPRPAAFGLRGR